jgi:hypothetical protein
VEWCGQHQLKAAHQSEDFLHFEHFQIPYCSAGGANS